MRKQLLIFCSVILQVLACGLLATVLAADQQFVNLGNGICHDTQTGLMWQLGKSRSAMTSEEKALEYTRELDLGEFKDWRLPTMAERWQLTQNVLLYKNAGPCDFVHFENAYWTSETTNGTEPMKLGITCMCAGDEEIDIAKKGYVRAVRGSRQASSPAL
ncbi:MAG: hypothetical protein COZ12_06570 [Deltaproteobacteria bacterium CG_4_10_14_3_um_filter_60_8]|nr:MAG: hypothetical protein AUK28_01030 [Desulfobacterales bacterium CG2_30_60_27]PIY21100.1 MAG: hypothetical protein COZ12_06570 [Deltaproteobacteria bacterium CG_4_10_14_3_um_filter_60_8]